MTTEMQVPPSELAAAVAAGPAGEGGRHAPRGARAAKGLAANALLWLLALLLLLPLVWVVATSLRPSSELYSSSPSPISSHLTLENFRQLLEHTHFVGAIVNSAIVSAVVVTVGTYLSALAGYAFAMYRFRGRDALFTLVLATLAVPVVVTVIPNYVVMAHLGLLNTLLAVILPQLAPPFAVFWMRQYIASAIPPEMLNAARLDGAGEFRIFRSIVLPNVRAGLAGVAIWLFLMSWNNLLLPLTYIQSESHETYPLFLTSLQHQLGEPTLALVIAASVLASLPIVVIYLFAQRQFVSAATSSAVKG